VEPEVLEKTSKIFCSVEALTSTNSLVPQKSAHAFFRKPCISYSSGCKGMGPEENIKVTGNPSLYETEAPNGCQGMVLKLLSWSQK